MKKLNKEEVSSQELVTKKRTKKTNKKEETSQELVTEESVDEGEMDLEGENSEIIKITGQIIVRSYYDFQLLRMALMNRIRDIIRKRKEKIPFNAVEEKKEERTYEKKYSDAGLLATWNELLELGEITKVEYNVVLKAWELAVENKATETKYQSLMNKFVSQEPLYNHFLSKVKGIGIVLSANIIKEFGNPEVTIIDKETKEIVGKESDDFAKFEEAMSKYITNPDAYIRSGYSNISKLWANTGQSVVDGKAPKLKKGETAKYNPRLKTLVWKISDSLLTHNEGVYRRIYDGEKAKQVDRVYAEGELYAIYGKPYKHEDVKLIKGHIHNRALRKMRKVFLDHLWCASRELCGLPAEKSYVEGVLGHTHIITWKEAISLEGSHPRVKKGKKETTPLFINE